MALERPPKVSVLVPNRNHGRFLGEALSSILEQDFTDFELIASDDASTDDSPQILADFTRRDARMRFTRQPVNLGLARNWNWLLAQARGEYIKFVFADDKLTRPDSLRKLVLLLDANPKVVLAACAAQIINEHSEVQQIRAYFEDEQVEDGRATCRRCLVEGGNHIGEPPLVLFRRRCAGSGFNPTYRYWVDVEFFVRVLEQGQFAYCTEPLAAFRIHEGQQTQLLAGEHVFPLEFYRLVLDFADRPWLGLEAARRRLFEEFYQGRKRGGLPPVVNAALERSLEQLGRHGYAAFLMQRKLNRPFENLARWWRQRGRRGSSAVNARHGHDVSRRAGMDAPYPGGP